MFTGSFAGSLEDTKSNYFAWEKSAESIDFKLIYAEMAGGALAGLILSQIVYWHLPAKSGKSRLRVVKDGQLWLAKSRRAWWDECRATEDEARGAIRKLSNPNKLKQGILKGTERPALIEIGKWRFDNAPTTHIRIVWENFLPLLEYVSVRLAEQESSRLGKFPNLIGEIPPTIGDKPQSLTEITTETTDRDFKPAASVDQNFEILLDFGVRKFKAETLATLFDNEEIASALEITHNKDPDSPAAFLVALLNQWAADPTEKKLEIAAHAKKVERQSTRETRHYRSGEFKDFWDD